MSFARSTLIAAAVLGAVAPGAAVAQTTESPPSTSSRIQDVSRWTEEQWNSAKAEWSKEKERWADCEKQAQDQNLTGRKSWSFLASCMTN